MSPSRLLAVLLAAALPAVEVPLASPASTIIPVTGAVPPGGLVVSATVTVPADAPSDLGIGAWAGDRHGSWAGRPAGRLTPGTHQVRIDLGADAPAEGPAGWGPWRAQQTARAGLFLWSAQPSSAVLRIDDLRVESAALPLAPTRVVDLAWPATAATGQRWQATFRTDPEPSDPFDPAVIRSDLEVTRPDGLTERRPAFWDQPMADRDRGDAEEVVPQGPGRFAVRWRPRIPGLHRLRLVTTWADGRSVAADLPPVTVTGPPWDAYARPDPQDPRFLQIEGRFWWPIGANLRSLNDDRSVEQLKTRLVPERGTRAYAAFLDRYRAAGIDASEIWMSSLNLALEWNPAWQGYGGAGRYHLARAWQLDRIFDRAEANGQRLILVFNNHGQGSNGVDREWPLHPYRQANGGFLDNPADLFTSERARDFQARMRRYLVARYGDSPALLAWKLWSEVDLTEAGRTGRWPEVTAWHEAAAADLARLDVYAHPVTTHFSGTWRRVHPTVAQLPGLGLLAIDAYHPPVSEPSGISIADLLASSTTARALGRYKKPVLATEYGGDWRAAPPVALAADLAIGPWAALVSGHAGGPMFWWSNWLDQGNRYGTFGAIRAFIAGEDLRGAEAASQVLRGQPEDLWVRAWVRPGRMLGYVLSRRFAAEGEEVRHSAASIRLGEVVSPGPVAVQWWNADTGQAGPVITFDHPGGPLVLEVPPFTRHTGFKLWRTAPKP